MIKNPFGKVYAIHLDRHTERKKTEKITKLR